MPDPLLTGRGMTMSDQLARHARTAPDDVALRFGAARRTYRELDDRATRLANALRLRGIGPGDRIAVLGHNGIEVIECYYAAARLGAICVPVNFRLVADEIAYVLADSGAAAVLVDETFADVVAAARAKARCTEVCLVIGDARSDGAERYEDALREASTEPVDVAVDEHSPAFVMYTSGTTGHPKGAVLTHRNLLMHTFSMLVQNGVCDNDRVGLSGGPLFHVAGLAAMLPTLLIGGTWVVARTGGFDPAEAVAVLERERVTSCFFVPAQWQAICAVPDIAERDLSALRRVTWGAAPASTDLLRRMIETFPDAEVTSVFGQTECSPVTTMLRGADALRKIGSVGKPILNVEARIVDDDMNDVPPGEVGEIVYRGPMVMQGYWGRPEETAEAFRGGWFHSGDLVRQDEDGYLFVVDRKKDMIISGGENIYCAEVENTLHGHPKIAEVSLIGVPDPKWGETPLAVLVPREAADPPTAEELLAWSRERMAAYKCPRRIQVVGELPRNPSGKVLKNRLREQYSK
ncbi:fatty-acid--CoA ligase FadD5 [Saccharopolyspora rosea]|uniref:Long-chain-fatty-acid--CoA ligase n=1 Tax=Saccharopolyspora rosea TaxID=524884 RepID=A0ABW3FRY8_9PSEU